jgi:hypothetical protein
VKKTWAAEVGSACAAAASMVTVGGVVSRYQVTELSVEVEARLASLAPFSAAPAGIVATTTPPTFIPETLTV